MTIYQFLLPEWRLELLIYKKWLSFKKAISHHQTDERRQLESCLDFFAWIAHFRHIKYSASLRGCEAEHQRNIFLFPWVSV
jgi:hypothetical protein